MLSLNRQLVADIVAFVSSFSRRLRAFQAVVTLAGVAVGMRHDISGLNMSTARSVVFLGR